MAPKALAILGSWRVLGPVVKGKIADFAACVGLAPTLRCVGGFGRFAPWLWAECLGRSGGHPDLRLGLLDLFTRDRGGILARVGIRGGEDFYLFLLGFFGFFVAFVFLFGHWDVLSSRSAAARMLGRLNAQGGVTQWAAGGLALCRGRVGVFWAASKGWYGADGEGHFFG